MVLMRTASVVPVTRTRLLSKAPLSDPVKDVLDDGGRILQRMAIVTKSKSDMEETARVTLRFAIPDGPVGVTWVTGFAVSSATGGAIWETLDKQVSQQSNDRARE